MTTADENAKAYQAIGEYFCAFSAVEYGLGEAIKFAFGLQNNEASDAIIAALGDFSRKGRIVQAAIRFAKKRMVHPLPMIGRQRSTLQLKKLLVAMTLTEFSLRILYWSQMLTVRLILYGFRFVTAK